MLHRRDTTSNRCMEAETMRLGGIHIADVIAGARTRAASLVRWPPVRELRRPAEPPPVAAARIDPEENAAWEAVVREAFQAGPTLGATRATPPAHTPGIARLATSVSARAVRSSSAPTRVFTPAPEPAPEPASVEPPELQHRTEAGATAPDHLLRAPTSVASVADDFFDGLIRRVEGDP